MSFQYLSTIIKMSSRAIKIMLMDSLDIKISRFSSLRKAVLDVTRGLRNRMRFSVMEVLANRSFGQVTTMIDSLGR
jgi:hypothetical protein